MLAVRVRQLGGELLRAEKITRVAGADPDLVAFTAETFDGFEE